ncbi:endonuclease dU [Archaeoglobus veneficus]|uniref:UPF0215 protein Arcve_2111 n=1 Tax=Archaeoglobus veneficus (strain DSM 11195 / SNP6) TaxID=693661 RepID=F2KSN0_ARCVS|nr:DUF99 family protein [Archaeoglobus veneficus]AEA48100.1 UPF0215 protein [Archaeoglobus veneficus SNP6]
MVKQWRFVGFDDGFSGFTSKNACIVGCVTAGTYVEGFLYERIEVDGFDVSEKIISMINDSKFREQIRCIFLPGITFAGMNIADIQEIHRNTGIPVVVVMKKLPDFDGMERAISRTENPDERRRILEKAGEIKPLFSLFVQLAGCSEEDAKNYIRASTLKGNTPECLRIAHLVASAIVYGESRKA